MFEALETGAGLDIVLWFQSIRTPLLDSLAIFLHEMGRDLLYLTVLAFIYWSFNKTLGIRVLLLLLVATITATALKFVFLTPRPADISDLIIPLVEETNYGIPSGHSAISLAVWGYLALKLGKRWMVGLAMLYAFIQGLSRMYLGVHYPQDVIAGWLTGVVIIAFFWRIETPLYNFWTRISMQTQLALVTLASIIALLMIATDNAGLSALGVLWGGGVGLILEEKLIHFSSDGTRQQRILRYVLGLLLLLVVFYGLRILFTELEPAEVFRVIRYAVLGVTALAVWPLICLRTGLMSKEAE